MREKKRLLILANRFYPQIGGAELNIYYQALEFSKHFEVDVFTPLRENDKRLEQIDGVRIFRAYNVRNPLNKFPYLPAKTLCPSLIPRILFGNYDAIHCFPALSHNNIVALALARWMKIPIFLSNFDAFDYAKLMDEGMEFSEFSKLRLPERSVRRLAQFNGIFTISQRETDLLLKINPNTELSTVPILLDEYTGDHDTGEFRKRFGIGEDQRMVLSLSRVSYIKGQDLLLESIPILKERLDNFVVVFVGRTDYEPDYFAEMKVYIRENQLEDQVIFTGPVSREDVITALKACDVHVLPMRFMNSGAINTETWASGRPIIQSNRVDPNYVEEGVNGYTFDVEDPNELAEKLDKTLNDPELSRTMGANGQQLATEKFTYPALIAQYMDGYRRYSKLDVRAES